jgi:hypothetical protein
MKSRFDLACLLAASAGLCHSAGGRDCNIGPCIGFLPDGFYSSCYEIVDQGCWGYVAGMSWQNNGQAYNVYLPCYGAVCDTCGSNGPGEASCSPTTTIGWSFCYSVEYGVQWQLQGSGPGWHVQHQEGSTAEQSLCYDSQQSITVPAHVRCGPRERRQVLVFLRTQLVRITTTLAYREWGDLVLEPDGPSPPYSCPPSYPQFVHEEMDCGTLPATTFAVLQMPQARYIDIPCEPAEVGNPGEGGVEVD